MYLGRKGQEILGCVCLLQGTSNIKQVTSEMKDHSLHVSSLGGQHLLIHPLSGSVNHAFFFLDSNTASARRTDNTQLGDWDIRPESGRCRLIPPGKKKESEAGSTTF